MVWKAAIEAILTIRPGNFSCMSFLATSHDKIYGPVKLVPITVSISSSDCFTAHWASGMPALFTRVVIVPNCPSTAATASLMVTLSLISIGTTAQIPPSDSISCLRTSNLSMRLAEIATLAPHLANTLAKRYPNPEDAPVTKAT